jgi:hypothetical protein
MTMPDTKNCRDCGRRIAAEFEYCASCLSRRLAERTEELITELLPAAKREAGGRYRCGSVAGEQGQSMVINTRGHRRGRFYDFGGTEHGDMLDLVRLVECGGDMGTALRHAHERLRLPVRAPQPRRHETPAPADPSEEEAARRQKALELWQYARPLQSGDLAWRYLSESRGIPLDRLQPLPSLRFHRRLIAADRSAWPALVAAIARPDAKHIAGIHRTFLTEVDGRVQKAPIDGGAKRSLGSYAGGLIWLWRGASARPWCDPEPGTRLALAEGIEDGLSFVAVMPAVRTAVMVSISNWRIELPSAIERVLLVGQNEKDGADSKAEAVRRKLTDHLRHLGKTVEIARPRDRQVKDLNDLTLAARLRAHLAVECGGDMDTAQRPSGTDSDRRSPAWRPEATR